MFISLRSTETELIAFWEPLIQTCGLLLLVRTVSSAGEIISASLSSTTNPSHRWPSSTPSPSKLVGATSALTLGATASLTRIHAVANAKDLLRVPTPCSNGWHSPSADVNVLSPPVRLVTSRTPLPASASSHAKLYRPAEMTNFGALTFANASQNVEIFLRLVSAVSLGTPLPASALAKVQAALEIKFSTKKLAGANAHTVLSSAEEKVCGVRSVVVVNVLPYLVQSGMKWTKAPASVW